MKFRLDVMREGSPDVIEFDNQANIFSDGKTGINLLASSRCADYLRITPQFRINRNDIGVLYINLGLNCNFCCRYCHQNKFRNSTEVVSCSPDKARGLIEILKRANLQPRAVSFWGGEPLVHWKAMKVLIPELKKLYPSATINFPTNGALFNEEIFTFLKAWDVGFYISYDGVATNRDKGVFDDPKIAAWFQRTGDAVDIMPTQNRASQPVENFYEEFKARGIKLRSVSCYSIARCNPYNREQAEEIRIPQDKIDAYSDFVYRVLRGEVKHDKLYRGLKSRFDHAAGIFYNGLGVDSAETSYCGNMTGRDVCIDAAGNVFNCMNIPLHRLGHIETFTSTDASGIFTPHFKKKTCMNCPFVSICRGGCPLVSDENSVEFQVNCHNLKALAVPVFRMIIEALLGVYLKKITRLSDGRVFGEF